MKIAIPGGVIGTQQASATSSIAGSVSTATGSKRGRKKKVAPNAIKKAATAQQLAAMTAKSGIETLDRDTVLINGIEIDIEKITDEQLYSLRKVLPRKDYRLLKNRKSARKSRKRRKAELSTLRDEIKALRHENEMLKKQIHGKGAKGAAAAAPKEKDTSNEASASSPEPVPHSGGSKSALLIQAKNNQQLQEVAAKIRAAQQADAAAERQEEVKKDPPSALALASAQLGGNQQFNFQTPQHEASTRIKMPMLAPIQYQQSLFQQPQQEHKRTLESSCRDLLRPLPINPIHQLFMLPHLIGQQLGIFSQKNPNSVSNNSMSQFTFPALTHAPIASEIASVIHRPNNNITLQGASANPGSVSHQLDQAPAHQYQPGMYFKKQ